MSDIVLASLPVYDEKLVIGWLRDNDAVTAIFGDKLYSALPKTKVWPACRIQRVGGSLDRFGWTDHPLLQIDVWGSGGGGKSLARLGADTIRQQLPAIIGAHDDGVVTDVLLGGLNYLPDPDFNPAIPRYVFDAQLTVHPTS